MRHFIVTLFCSFLSTGNLQTIDNALNYQMPPAENVLGPEVAEENIWPMQAYQTFQGNFYGTARRSINPKPCLRQSNPQDVLFEHKNQIARHGNNVPDVPLVQTMNSQVERHISNTQDVAPQPPVNNQVESQYSNTQYMSMQQPVDNHLINQVEDPSPTRRSSLTETEKKTEIIETTNLRTQVTNDEVPSALRSSNSDDMGESLRSSNNFENLRSSENIEGTENQENPENQPDSGSSENHEDAKSSELINEEKNTLAVKTYLEESSSQENLSEEKNLEVTPSIFRINNEEKYSFEETTDQIVSLPTIPPPALRELSYQDVSYHTHDTSNVQCSEGKNPSDIKIPEAPRRFLIGSNNNPAYYQKSVMTKNVARSPDMILPNNEARNIPNINPDISPGNNFGTSVASNPAANQGSTYSAYTNSVLRSNTNNPEYPENQVRNQNQDTSITTNILKEPTDLTDKSTTAKKVGRSGNLHYLIGNNKNSMYNDPAQGQGISYVKKTTLMLMDYDRICYACSTANNPTCATPDRKTSVKYCRKGDNACVTKSFGAGSTLTLIRDCGRSCADAEIPGLVPKFKTCSICYSDLCNSAYSINVHSLILTIPIIVLLALVKPLL